MLNCALFSSGCLADVREKRSHSGTYVETTYTGSYLRGVTVSISGAEPNPDTGAVRVAVKQTYSFRRDLAGFGADGCQTSEIGKKSNKIGPADEPLNKAKYHKAMAFFEDEKADTLAGMMDIYRENQYPEYSTRVGDSKNMIEWKINYYLRNITQNNYAFPHDNYCMGDMEDVIEASPLVTDPTSFLFRNRHEGGTNWMVIVADNDERTVKYGTKGGAALYEKYKFGAAMFDVTPRSDTGKMNNSPVATLPGDFLMPANCVSSYQVMIYSKLPIVFV